MDAEAIRFSASVGLRFAHRFARACLAPPHLPSHFIRANFSICACDCGVICISVSMLKRDAEAAPKNINYFNGR